MIPQTKKISDRHLFIGDPRRGLISLTFDSCRTLSLRGSIPFILLVTFTLFFLYLLVMVSRYFLTCSSNISSQTFHSFPCHGPPLTPTS